MNKLIVTICIFSLFFTVQAKEGYALTLRASTWEYFWVDYAGTTDNILWSYKDNGDYKYNLAPY